MSSPDHPGDEWNTSFGAEPRLQESLAPAEHRLQESKPGVEQAAEQPMVARSEYRVQPSAAGELDPTPLAELNRNETPGGSMRRTSVENRCAYVRFTNSYSCRLYVAYMRFEAGCGGDPCNDPWYALGWIALDVGQTQTRPNPSDNRWFYHYAEAEGADQGVWAGPYPAHITHDVFEQCRCIDSPSQIPGWYWKGMRELDLSQFGGVTYIA
ncbi:hypothetical protein [Mycobacterium sp. 852014-50255_SCH5639931]|uniref:hypothetical protein n=1 Tax=Mycobacterium sp. 852014-50255_SCH5639931 TaxID=1834112 RepID=UPI000A7A6768|nr:hypothetical protein [Mycobacterium sp. 852014-50255_SCH5639931]